MRTLAVTAFAATIAFGGAALADPPNHAFRNGSAWSPSPEFHISGASVPVEQFAEWDSKAREGATVLINWGKDTAKAPKEAVKYEQKTFAFPTGTIRVLDFKKANGGVLHMITMENEIFVLKGTVTVDVAGQNVTLNAGDAAYYPSGVMRGKGDATILSWNVTGTVPATAAKAQVVRAKEAPTSTSAEWDGPDGKRVKANKPEELKKMPKNAIKLAVTRYTFDGNSVRVAKNYKGGPTSPASGGLDALIYVTSGKLKFFQDGKEADVVPGDAIREIAGARHYWNRLEDSSFVATSSLPIAGTKPGPATDR